MPAVEVAEPIEIEPLAPELARPELNASKPEVPPVPALADTMVRAPLVLAMP